jgi:hypothetical protein
MLHNPELEVITSEAKVKREDILEMVPVHLLLWHTSQEYLPKEEKSMY